MALNAPLLAQQLITAAGVQPGDAAGVAAWTLVANILVAHIQTNAQVTVVGTATGAMSGGPGVPVVGTGTIQ